MKVKENLILLMSSIILLMVFIAICIIVYNSGGTLIVDANIRDFFYSIRGEKYGLIFWIFRILTELADIYFIIVLAIATLIYSKLDIRWILFLSGILITTVINRGVKSLYCRQRPFEANWWMEESSYSFPSGHSTNAGFMYSFIGYCVYKENINKILKRCLIGACIAIIPIIMISRMVLGVHYFTDVCAGAASGLMVSLALLILLNYYQEKKILVKGLLVREKQE